MSVNIHFYLQKIMKNKINLSIKNFPEDNDTNWVIDTFRGVLLKKAEEDYITCRILFMLNLLDPAYYHLQQCIEKYLKTFILDRDIKIVIGRDNQCNDFKKNGHKLEEWGKLCWTKDDFFNDQDLIIALTNISHFEEISRYPQNRIQSWGSCPALLLKFLDEFVFEMRKRIEHKQYSDVIEKFSKGYISAHPALTYKFNKSITAKQIQEFLFHENDYFKL